MSETKHRPFNTELQEPMQWTLSIHELAPILKKSVATIRADMVRNKASVPPWVKAPGSRRPIWISTVVRAWIQDLAQGPDERPHDLRRHGRQASAR